MQPPSAEAAAVLLELLGPVFLYYIHVYSLCLEFWTFFTNLNISESTLVFTLHR